MSKKIMSAVNKKFNETKNEKLRNLAVKNFRDYLKIPSVQPNINYDQCVNFIKVQAKTLGLPCQVYYCFPKKPVVVLTWIGREPNLPTILLNGHMDVVPVFKEKWTYPPFSAKIDKRKNIYARGAQDMKCVSIQYLEAIRRLKLNKVTLKRTVHVSFVPDEEIGGIEGMCAFSKSEYFKNLNVGFALDEGMTSFTEYFAFTYGERSAWKVHFHCPGQSGDGSFLKNGTPGEKIEFLMNKLYRFRDEEKQKLKENALLKIGDVTTVNVTKIQGGGAPNTVPEELSIVVDCRIPLSVDILQWEATLNQWCTEAGDGVWIEYEQKQPQVPATKLDASNPYWIAFKQTADKLKLKLAPRIMSGETDMRFLRALGVPAIGFSPINKTPGLAHGHNEFLNQDIFLRGIDIYYEIIPAAANV